MTTMLCTILYVDLKNFHCKNIFVNHENITQPLQLWPGLHRGDQTETGDKAEGTPGCL